MHVLMLHRPACSIIAVAVMLSGVNSVARATSLTPGGTSTPGSGMPSAVANGTVVQTQAVTFGVSSLNIWGTLYETVVQEKNGNYDFLYQVKEKSGDLTSFTVSDFSGYATNVSQSSGPGSLQNSNLLSGTTKDPLIPVATDSRSTDGAGVTFTFGSGTGALTAGDTSYVEIIQTNDSKGTADATMILTVSGHTFILDPVGPQAVAEPSSFLLFGGVFIGVAAWLIRRRRTVAKGFSPAL